VGDSAYQITAGVRAFEVLGAEVDYFDLGSGEASPSWAASGSYSVTRARISQHGEAAFAVLYLPVPIVDFYVKAGVARITSDLSASLAGTACPRGAFCPAILTGGIRVADGALNTTATTFAAGAGVQWQVGNWAIRGEYERFTSLRENPSPITLGATWSFL
jgi:opacity protein-like surface antigen